MAQRRDSEPEPTWDDLLLTLKELGPHTRVTRMAEAAEEMYDALEAIVARVDNTGSFTLQDRSLLARAHAAIQKANPDNPPPTPEQEAKKLRAALYYNSSPQPAKHFGSPHSAARQIPGPDEE